MKMIRFIDPAPDERWRIRVTIRPLIWIGLIICLYLWLIGP